MTPLTATGPFTGLTFTSFNDARMDTISIATFSISIS